MALASLRQRSVLRNCPLPVVMLARPIARSAAREIWRAPNGNHGRGAGGNRAWRTIVCVKGTPGLPLANRAVAGPNHMGPPQDFVPLAEGVQTSYGFMESVERMSPSASSSRGSSRISQGREPYRSGSVSMFVWSDRAMIPSRNATSAGSVMPCHDRQLSAPCGRERKVNRTRHCVSAAGSRKCWRSQMEKRS
jgi:hypothetical protein